MESDRLTFFQCDACDGSCVTRKLNSSGLRENAIWKSRENGTVKNALSAAEIAAIREEDGHAAKHLHLALNAGIPKPALRTEEPRGIRDGATVEKRSKLQGEEAVLVDILVHLPIRQEVSPSERRSALSPIDCAGVSAKPEVIVAFDAQLEKFIDGDFAGGSTSPNARLHLGVIPFRSATRVGKKRSAQRGKRTETVGKFTACAQFGRGIQREAALGDAQQRAAGAKPSCERSGCSKE